MEQRTITTTRRRFAGSAGVSERSFLAWRCSWLARGVCESGRSSSGWFPSPTWCSQTRPCSDTRTSCCPRWSRARPFPVEPSPRGVPPANRRSNEPAPPSSFTCIVPSSLLSGWAGAAEPEEIAPRFHLTQRGARVETDLADLRGRVVVLDFFAHWCVPCVRASAEVETEIERSLPAAKGQRTCRSGAGARGQYRSRAAGQNGGVYQASWP